MGFEDEANVIDRVVRWQRLPVSANRELDAPLPVRKAF